MKLPLGAGAGTVLAACAIAAAVAPAAAAAEQPGALPQAPAETPVDIPLHRLEAVSPFKAPTVSGMLSTPTMTRPSALPKRAPGAVLPEPLLPPLPAHAKVPALEVEAPLPELLGRNTPRLATPAVPLKAATPGLALGMPFDAPEIGEQRLPRLVAPKAGIVTPVVQGSPVADLGLI
jgi:hypothetical protein